MNRSLLRINFLGLIAMAVLSTFQWRTNRDLNLQTYALEKVHQEQAEKLAKQDKALTQSTADLEHFRGLLTSANAAARKAELQLKSVVQEAARITLERDQLKMSMTNWAAAVAARDERLKEIADQFQALAVERNEALQNFNDLAQKYNAVVNDLNTRTTNYNVLVERFNALNKPARTNSAP